MGRTIDVPEDTLQESETSNVVLELLKQAGGCVVTDGGFATQLERHGANINDPLWSAVCLITMPDLIRKVFVQSIVKYLFCLLYRQFKGNNTWIWGSHFALEEASTGIFLMTFHSFSFSRIEPAVSCFFRTVAMLVCAF